MLSPQIYIAKFDKTLTFNVLDHTSHKVSSLVIAGPKAKAQKAAKTRENAPHGNDGDKSKNAVKKSVREMAVV